MTILYTGLYMIYSVILGCSAAASSTEHTADDTEQSKS